MGAAWDDAVDCKFARRVRELIARTTKDCEETDPYNVAEEIGRAVLDEVESTYGLDTSG